MFINETLGGVGECMKQRQTWAFEKLIATVILAVGLMEIGCMDTESALASAADDDSTYSDEESDAGDTITVVDDRYIPQTAAESLPIQVSADDATVNTDECSWEVESYYQLGKQTSSAAGAVLARAALRSGTVPTTPIRDLEFLNYYLRGSESAGAVEPSIIAEKLHGVSENTPELPLLLSVLPPVADETARTSVNLVLAVDVSASMSGAPIETARAACRAAIKSLVPGDAVTVLAWNTEAETLSAPDVIGSDKSDIIDACDALSAVPETETDLHVALTDAYEAVDILADESRISHILLISDGGSPAGVTDKTLVQTRAADAEAPVFLSVLGVSAEPALYNESLLRMFADSGKGLHFYADTSEESINIIENYFINNLSMTAASARFRLVLPPGFRTLVTDDAQGDVPLPTPLFSGRSMHFLVFPEYCDISADAVVGSVTFTMEYMQQDKTEPSLISSQSAFSTAAQEDESANTSETADIVMAYTAALRALQSESKEIVAKKIESAKILLESSASPDALSSNAFFLEIEDMLSICKRLSN